MIGAEVDFYIQGLEDQPELAIKTIIEYFHVTDRFQGLAEFQNFSRGDTEKLNISTAPWLNKSLFIKLYMENEGRDLDNRHGFPYIGVQVRYDDIVKHRVAYSWEDAHNYLKR